MRDEFSIGVGGHGSVTTRGGTSSDAQELVVYGLGLVLCLLALKVIEVTVVRLRLELTLALDDLDHGVNVLLAALLGQEDSTEDHNKGHKDDNADDQVAVAHRRG